MKFSDFYKLDPIATNVDEWKHQYMCEHTRSYEDDVKMVIERLEKTHGRKCHYRESTKLIDVDGFVDVFDEWVVGGKLIVKFGHVLKSFTANQVNLRTLEGMPHTVDGSFDCILNTDLKSAVGGPTYVGGYCNYGDNGLTTVEGLPTFIGTRLYLDNNPLTSLHNIHKHVKQLGGMIRLNERSRKSSVKSNVLGLLMIHGLKCVDLDDVTGEIFYETDNDWQQIVNKYLLRPGDHSEHIYDCQMDLVDAGYEEYAKL